MLEQVRDALKREVRGRPAVAAAGGDGFDQLMNQAGDEEDDDDCDGGVADAAHRAEDERIGEVAEGGVPSARPELTETPRAGGRAHDRFDRDAGRSPGQREQLEQAEVQAQNQTEHADPTRDERPSADNRLAGDREQRQSGREPRDADGPSDR
jgi:hypothetical protein